MSARPNLFVEGVCTKVDVPSAADHFRVAPIADTARPARLGSQGCSLVFLICWHSPYPAQKFGTLKS